MISYLVYLGFCVSYCFLNSILSLSQCDDLDDPDLHRRGEHAGLNLNKQRSPVTK